MIEKLNQLKPKYLNFIINPINGRCNLKCSYCYARENEFLKRETNLNYKSTPIFKWFPLLLKGLNLLHSLRVVTFTWHGGEPLLLPCKFYQQIRDDQKTILKKSIKYRNVIQTNGLLLNSQRSSFFSKNGFDIGISIDGPEYEQNLPRFNSRKSFGKLKRNILNLSKSKIPFALFMVIHEGNVDSEKQIFSFIKKVAPENGVSFIPRFNKKSYLNPQKYARFLKEFFDLWWPERKPYVAILENFISGLEERKPKFCFLTNRCEAFISLDAEGNMYSTCQPTKRAMVGNINKEQFKVLLLKHEERIKKIIKIIKNERLYFYLGGAGKYRYFSGKGCPKRLTDNNKDPYLKSFSAVIQHIENRLKGTIIILGAGVGNGLLGLTMESYFLLMRADEIYARIDYDRIVKELKAKGKKIISLTNFYKKFDSFKEAYEGMANFIVKKARAGKKIVYLVPGHPLVCEYPTELIVKKAKTLGLRVKILPAVSFLDSVLIKAEFDPGVGIQFLAASELLKRKIYENLTPSLACCISCISDRSRPLGGKTAYGMFIKFLRSKYSEKHPVKIIYQNESLRFREGIIKTTVGKIESYKKILTMLRATCLIPPRKSR